MGQPHTVPFRCLPGLGPAINITKDPTNSAQQPVDPPVLPRPLTSPGTRVARPTSKLDVRENVAPHLQPQPAPCLSSPLTAHGEVISRSSSNNPASTLLPTPRLARLHYPDHSSTPSVHLPSRASTDPEGKATQRPSPPLPQPVKEAGAATHLGGNPSVTPELLTEDRIGGASRSFQAESLPVTTGKQEGLAPLEPGSAAPRFPASVSRPSAGPADSDCRAGQRRRTTPAAIDRRGAASHRTFLVDAASISRTPHQVKPSSLHPVTVPNSTPDR